MSLKTAAAKRFGLFSSSYLKHLVKLVPRVESLIGETGGTEKIRYYGVPNRNGPNTIELTRANSYISYRSSRVPHMFKLDENAYVNLYESIRRRADSCPNKTIMGRREVVAAEDETQTDGKILRKYRMRNDYSWMTYAQMMDRIDRVANGLLRLGLKSNENIVIFAETRPEWLICAIACFKINVPIVTLYSTLGNQYFILLISLLIDNYAGFFNVYFV